MTKKEQFCLDWCAGASTLLEFFEPTQGGKGVYQFKYTSAFRSTLRPPLEELSLGSGELDPIDQELNSLATALEARSGSALPATEEGASPVGSLQQMEDLGTLLFDLTIPRYVQSDLRPSNLMLEVGMDESLLRYPWELMHDGDEFLCLKHYVGRFVNRKIPTPGSLRARGINEVPFKTLRILLIVVPNPQPRPNGAETYEPLPEADAEAKAIAKAVAGIPGVSIDVIRGKDATYLKISNKLGRGEYHIIHFCGHAAFDDANPRHSALVLFDRDLTTGAVMSLISRNPPVLCFINACETAKTAAGKDPFNVYGLAQAFLETGAYLLGSRWKVNDKAASSFATRFYDCLLNEEKALGCAVREARVACKESAPEDEFAWASYIFYGDPRVFFRRE